MGQSPSSPALFPDLTRLSSSRSFRRSSFSKNHIPMNQTPETLADADESSPTDADYTSSLPDECLALIFTLLSAADRNRSSIACKRWLSVEGQSRHRLSLNALSSLSPSLPSLFSRFDSVTKLTLRSDRRSLSLSDADLLSVSLHCPNLSRLKLRATTSISDSGLAALAQHSVHLKKLSCSNCSFGIRGLNSVFLHCKNLEELSVKRLRGINNNNDNNNGSEPEAMMIGDGDSYGLKCLRSVCLKELYNGQVFGPVIVAARNLRVLKVIKCLGDWDRVLEGLNEGVVEVHLERLQVSDAGLLAVSKCAGLEVFHVVKTPDVTSLGVVSVAERCRGLRKVHIDGWRTNRIGDEGLTALGRNCGNLQELVLIGVNASVVSLEVIASGCRGLERLALCTSETIHDAELSCLATKCMALKKLCIKSCVITNTGLEALAWGCPNLVKVKVKKCRGVSRDIIDWLKVRRESLIVNLDCDEEVEAVDASASDAGGAQEEVLDAPQPIMEEDTPPSVHVPLPPARSNSTRQSLLRSKFGFLMGRNLASFALRRWSMGNNSNSKGSSSNQ